MVGIAELIAICKTALEQGPTLIAKLASMRLSDEQIALLTAAQTDGAINVVELDAGLYPTVLIGQKSFAKPEDPATSARVYEAFSDLCSKGLVRHLSGNLFALTSAGFDKARKLADRDDAALRPSTMKLEEKVWWRIAPDGTREGPICPTCYGSKDRNVVFMIEEGDDHQCPVCKRWAKFRATASYGEAPEEPGGDWMKKVF